MHIHTDVQYTRQFITLRVTSYEHNQHISPINSQLSNIKKCCLQYNIDKKNRRKHLQNIITTKMLQQVIYIVNECFMRSY